jgi:hypothetical protein
MPDAHLVTDNGEPHGFATSTKRMEIYAKRLLEHGHRRSQPSRQKPFEPRSDWPPAHGLTRPNDAPFMTRCLAPWRGRGRWPDFPQWSSEGRRA